MQVELKVIGIHCISRAGPLPFAPADAARSQAELDASEGPDGEGFVGVAQDTRLDNRTLDLRTPANQAIFRVQSAISQVCQMCSGQDTAAANACMFSPSSCHPNNLMRLGRCQPDRLCL